MEWKTHLFSLITAGADQFTAPAAVLVKDALLPVSSEKLSYINFSPSVGGAEYV